MVYWSLLSIYNGYSLFVSSYFTKEKFLKTTASMGCFFSKSSFTLLALERLQDCELSYMAYIWIVDYMVVVSFMWLLTFLCN